MGGGATVGATGEEAAAGFAGRELQRACRVCRQALAPEFSPDRRDRVPGRWANHGGFPRGS